MADKNTFPEREPFTPQEWKKEIHDQKTKVVWFTGLSGAGKTTLARGLKKKLQENGKTSVLLDGDSIRKTLCQDLDYSIPDRTENIRRAAEVANLLCKSGIITIAAFITPTAEMRKMARAIIGESNLIEVFVNTPLEICEQRDNKGLYNKARTGELKNFTGISASYETPVRPDINLIYESKSIEACISEVFHKVEKLL